MFKERLIELIIWYRMRNGAENGAGGVLFDDTRALKKRRLSDLVEEVHADFDLDPDAERVLLSHRCVFLLSNCYINNECSVC